MASISAKSNIIAARYAVAFLDSSPDSKTADKIELDFNDLNAMIAASDDLRTLLSNPLIAKNDRQAAILAIAKKAKLQPLTQNFLGMLAANNRLNQLPAIISAFQQELRRRRGQVEANVQTAFALTPAQTKELQAQISRAMGSNVALNVSVNEDLLGGMAVTVGSRMIDDSVKRKLEKLKLAMKTGTGK